MKFVPTDILDSAVALIDAEGIGVSTAKVAAAAGVSNGTLFHYFRTRQELIDRIYLHLKAGLAEAIGAVDAEAPVKERARTVWDRWVRWGVSSPARHRVVLLLKGGDLVSRAAADEAETMFAEVSAVLASAAGEGLLVDMPLPYLAAAVEAQVDLAVLADLSEVERARAFEMAWASITTGAARP